MYLGLCPGNVGATTFYDANRRETQRDFADGVGTTSRALIEGLFGIKPDALAGELKIQPGFPAAWDHASIRHPDFAFSFKRQGNRETFKLTSQFPKTMKLRLQLPRLREEVERVTDNGTKVDWKEVDGVVGSRPIEIVSDTNRTHEIVIQWKGEMPKIGSWNPSPSKKKSEPSGVASMFNWTAKLPREAKFDVIDLTPHFNDRVTQIFRNEYLAPRSPFCSLATPKQGIGSWCHPNDSFDVADSGLRAAARRNGGKIVLPNGVPLATPGDSDSKNVLFASQWTNYPSTATVPLSGTASHAFLLM
jgi:hypothetical protein